MLPQCPCVLVCVYHTVLYRFASVVYSIPSVSYTLFASSSTGFSEPQRDKFDRETVFIPEYFKVSYPAYCPALSPGISSHLLQEVASLSEALIYGYSEISLRLMLLLRSFNITVVFGVTLVPALFCLRFLVI